MAAMAVAVPRASTTSTHQALIVVDVQNDFACPGGALYVEGAESVVAPIAKLVRSGDFAVVVATADCHPPGHVSFASSHEGATAFESRNTVQHHPLSGEALMVTQTMWPPHCVVGTRGQAFVSGLAELLTPRVGCRVVLKGTHTCFEAYSPIPENPWIVDDLRAIGITSVLVVGVATDYCVAATAWDLRMAGLDVRVRLSCCRGVSQETTRAAIERLVSIGCVIEE